MLLRVHVVMYSKVCVCVHLVRRKKKTFLHSSLFWLWRSAKLRCISCSFADSWPYRSSRCLICAPISLLDFFRISSCVCISLNWREIFFEFSICSPSFLKSPMRESTFYIHTKGNKNTYAQTQAKKVSISKYTPYTTYFGTQGREIKKKIPYPK